jgi:undecaprenyl-diphosphatase
MELTALDRTIFLFINRNGGAALDAIMVFLTQRGFILFFPYVMLAAARQWTIKRGGDSNNHIDPDATLWAAIVAVASFLLADWLSNELKHAICRVRPCNTILGARLLVGCTSSYSMPSGHAVNSFAAAVPLFYLLKNHIRPALRTYPFFVAAAVAVSRVYVGVHYPSDVLAGALMGSIVALAVILSYRAALKYYAEKPHATVLYGVLAVLSIFRIYYILHGPLDLSPDEAHYWEWTRRPALSYYSKGPLTACLIYIGTALFGDNVFGVRFFAVPLSAMAGVFTYRLVKAMYLDGTQGRPMEAGETEAAGVSAALLLQAIPLFSAYGVIFTIDSPFIFLWTWSLYLFYGAARQTEGGGEEGRTGAGYGPWILLGVVTGAGLMTKYTFLFFHLCAFLFLAATDRRALLKTPKPYVSLFVSMMTFSPVVVWNARNDWVSLKHTAGQTNIHEGLSLSAGYLLNFIGSQAGVVTPVMLVMILLSLYALRRSRHARQYRFIACFSVPVLVFFLLKSIQGKVQGNWAMPGYVTGIIALCRLNFSGGEWGECDPKRQCGRVPKRWRRGFAAAVLTAFLATAVGLFLYELKLPPNYDISSRLRGWREIGNEISKIKSDMETEGHVLIFSDKYQVASELAFYVEGHPRTFCINDGRRMNQYDLWPGMNEEAEALRRAGNPARGRGPLRQWGLGPLRQWGCDPLRRCPINGIMVREGDKGVPETAKEAFEGFEKRLFTVYEHGRPLKTWSIFVCRGFKGLPAVKALTY